jgi:glutamate formiminotransferase
VKALGLELKSQNLYQISMNLTDFEITKPKKVFDKITELAKKYGFEVVGSELIGLIPKAALPRNPQKDLKLKNFDESKIIENALFP